MNHQGNRERTKLPGPVLEFTVRPWLKEKQKSKSEKVEGGVNKEKKEKAAEGTKEGKSKTKTEDGKTKNGQNICEGPRGGHHNYNSKGNKTYVSHDKD